MFILALRVLVVHLEMSDEVLAAAEGLVADGADVGPVDVVLLHVLGQVVRGHEGLLAAVTLVHEDRAVQRHVPGQVVCPRELVVAHVTRVHLPLFLLQRLQRVRLHLRVHFYVPG